MIGFRFSCLFGIAVVIGPARIAFADTPAPFTAENSLEHVPAETPSPVPTEPPGWPEPTPVPEEPECDRGCDGICGSEKELDSCGVCGGNGPYVCGCGDDYSCLDCLGVPNGESTCECRLFKLEANYLGAFGLPEIFRKAENVPSCLQGEVDIARNLCEAAIGRENVFLDDCMVGAYFLADNRLRERWGLRGVPKGPWSVHIDQASCDELGIWREGTLYLDADCKAANLSGQDPAQACDAGLFQWKGSPISLIWERGYDIDREVRVTRFPLHPGRPESWTIWKASGEAPLLVYDPSHSGNVTSAAQLFGEWTFGGMKTALNVSASSIAAAPWRDGYAALATLDFDGNGELNGTELTNLGLWFDRNRDGISQAGEYQSLRAAGVKKLYVAPDGKNAATGSITASRGYVREIHGALVTGPSVDWYGEGGESKFELLSKYAGRSNFCSVRNPEVSTGAALQAQADARLENGMQTAKKTRAHTLNGLWTWKAEGDEQGGGAPQGYLTFSVAESGVLRGHSMSETHFTPQETGAEAMITFYALSGRAEEEKSFSFSIQTAAGTFLESKGELNAFGSIEGETFVRTNYKGQPVETHYRWTAVRAR